MFGSSSRTDTVENLKDKMAQLISKETDINCQLQREEMQFGKKRKREVDRWLTSVETKKQAVPVLVEKMKANWLPNFSAEKEAGNMIKEVEELLVQGNRFSGQELVLDDMEQFRGLQLIAPELKDQSSKKILAQIQDNLLDEDVLRVGICGVGGVGKTTLALHINNEMIRNDSHFCHVYWVTVSRETSIDKLQNDISKAMGLTIDREHDERRRASCIYMKLKERKKSLLILDDVWENISMDDIGIPIEKGVCKLLITTRRQSECDAMGCGRIMVSKLCEEEAWDLFVDQLGCYNTLSDKVREIAKLVAKECDGLPLGIKVMATCMRGVEQICEWRDTLKNLQESIVPFPEMQDKVFRVLYLSYAQLKDVSLQRCFLYCALYPEDYKIVADDLIYYFRAEKLVDISGSFREQKDGCEALLSRLRRAGLLDDGKSYYYYYKMHDLVRDMAVGIMKEEGAIIMAGMDLMETPREDLWSSSLTRVSLMKNGIDSIEPHAPPDCPSLTVLLLQKNPLRRISDYFFVNMKNLQTLDLSRTEIESLPDSISELGNLRALILRNCLELGRIPSLAKLENLLELCLRGCSFIIELPEGMENMRQLTVLDLGGCSNLDSFPAGLFSRLANLVQLALPSNLRINLKVLKNLKHLKNFEGSISGSPDDFNRFVKSEHFDQLQNYVILAVVTNLRGGDGSAVSRRSSWFDDIDEEIHFKESRTVMLSLCTASLLESPIMLPHNVEDLTIGEHDICPHPQSPESLGNDCLSVFGDCVVPKYGRLGCAYFENLEMLNVSKCSKVHVLFPVYMLEHHLPNLRVVSLSYCPMLKEVFGTRGVSEHANTSDEVIAHHKLEIIKLIDLPSLTQICTKTIICNSLMRLDVLGCNNLKRIPFSITNPRISPIKPVIYSERSWLESLEWDDPFTKQKLVKDLRRAEWNYKDEGWKKQEKIELNLAYRMYARSGARSRTVMLTVQKYRRVPDDIRTSRTVVGTVRDRAPDRVKLQKVKEMDSHISHGHGHGQGP